MLKLCDFSTFSDAEVIKHLVEIYEADPELLKKFKILAAYECGGGYEGSSFFLLREKETKELFEVHCSHCSCYGFEGQFTPTKSSIKYVLSEHFHAYISDGETEQVKKLVSRLR